jgi:hypothetical protein
MVRNRQVPHASIDICFTMLMPSSIWEAMASINDAALPGRANVDTGE